MAPTHFPTTGVHVLHTIDSPCPPACLMPPATCGSGGATPSHARCHVFASEAVVGWGHSPSLRLPEGVLS